MKIILKQKIKGLGEIGDVKNVKNGYARNFLLPKGLVLEATENNLKIIEKEKTRFSDNLKKEIETAQEFAKKLSAASVTIPVEAGDENKIFGSVGTGDISEALKAEEFEIDKKDIILESPIKELGAFDIEIKVHPKVVAKIKVWIVKKADN